MIGGSKQKMKTGFGGKIHGAGEVEKLVSEVDACQLWPKLFQQRLARLGQSKTKFVAELIP